MEKIEKKTERTVIDVKITYKAIDGTEFNTEAECKRYEETAEAVLMARLDDCVIHTCNGEDLFDSSSDGHYKAIVPKTQEHIDALNQLYKLYGGKSHTTVRFSEKNINTLIFMGYRMFDSCYDWVWFFDTSEVIEYCTGGKCTVSITNK